MCGIAGFLSYDKVFTHEDLLRMTSSLAHRGPDAEGFFEEGPLGFGHRRLSIIDLSTRANQPMISRSERYVIIYNGEVYNFTEIGARLKTFTSQNGGIRFRTSSDTEIILEAFAEYGVDFVHQLNGMFAIAIYDRQTEELYLFRDRLGIKPLYYFWDGKNFAFASELKALKLVQYIPKKINRSAIRTFLHLGYVPTPYSIYENIYKMNSGSWMRISKNGIELNNYWDLKNSLNYNVIRDKDEAMIKLSDLLTSSVQYQLQSDVPFGVFLSGGIDSSLVTAQAVQLSTLKVNTFSIGFEENSHNESEYAKAVAKYLGTDHHEFIVSYRDAVMLLDKVLDAYDEPFADSSALPTMMVSKLAKQYVTVALSGEGGDELFFGYGTYNWARRLSNPFYKLFHKPMAYNFSKMSSRYQRVGKLLDYKKGVNLATHIFSQEQYFFSENELELLLMDGYNRQEPVSEGAPDYSSLLSILAASSIPGKLEVKERKLSAMEQQAFFDLRYYLQDDLLTKVDRASMRYAVETRVPYLDHRVVEFSLNLSPSLKYRHGVNKFVLKEILYKYVPQHLFIRPKQGFSIPLNKWLKKELKYLIHSYLNEEIIKKYSVVKYDEVKMLTGRFFSGVDYLYNRLWLLIVLHRWLSNHSSQ